MGSTAQASGRSTATANGDAALAQVNQQVYERRAEDYRGPLALYAPERAMVARLRGRWAETDMLDLGVGAGRTAYTFAALARSYIGIDYAPRMVELSRELVGENEHTRFEVADARDLSRFALGQFDFVLFSFNGIDYVNHEDRLRILAEVRRLVAQEGWFLMSSHSLAGLRLRMSLPPLSHREPVRSLYRLGREGKRALKRAVLNRHLDLTHARERGWAVVRDQAHGFSLRTYYVLPEVQVSQLESAGFEVCDVISHDGGSVDPARPGPDVWLHYLCRPRP